MECSRALALMRGRFGILSSPVALWSPPHPGPACLAKWEVGVGNLKCSWLQSTFTRSHWSPAMTCFTPR